MRKIRNFKSVKTAGAFFAIFIGLSLTVISIHTAEANPSLWTKSGNPILSPTSNGWDALQVWAPRVLYDGNAFRMWYLGGPDKLSKVGYATSSDGTQWTKNSNPVFGPGSPGAWDSYQVTPGHIIRNGTQYLMWYRGRSAQANPGAFGLATSSDGVSWTKYTGNPVMTPSSTDANYLQYPYVIKVGNTFKMWFTERLRSGKLSIFYATSADGTHWTQQGSPVLIPSPGGWDSSSTYSPTVIYNAGSYWMFYSGASVSVPSVGYATSTDGVTWTKSTDSPIVSQSPPTGWDNADVDNQDAVLFQNRVMLFYSGAHFDGGNYVGYSIGLAQSPTGFITGSTVTTSPTTSIAAPGSPKCLIATATYGSELAPEVQLLRDFRDNSILKTAAGSNFMVAFNAWYYSFSPYVAGYLATHWVERTIMKAVLYPLIGIMFVSSGTFASMQAQPELAALVSGLVASALIGAFYVGLPVSLLRARVRRLQALNSQRQIDILLGIALLGSLIALSLGEVVAAPALLMISSAGTVLSTILLSANLISARIARKL